jgi:hypothetical protein
MATLEAAPCGETELLLESPSVDPLRLEPRALQPFQIAAK